MRALNLTSTYKADLDGRVERERAARSAEAERARRLAADAPPAGEPDKDARLWTMGGHYAMLFCLWALFLAPIVLLLTSWD